MRSNHEYPWISQKPEQGSETKEVVRIDPGAILNPNPKLEEPKPEPSRIADKFVSQEHRFEQKQEQRDEQEWKQEEHLKQQDKEAEQERIERVRAARIALLSSGISPILNSVSSTRSPPFKPLFQGTKAQPFRFSNIEIKNFESVLFSFILLELGRYSLDYCF